MCLLYPPLLCFTLPHASPVQVTKTTLVEHMDRNDNMQPEGTSLVCSTPSIESLRPPVSTPSALTDLPSMRLLAHSTSHISAQIPSLPTSTITFRSVICPFRLFHNPCARWASWLCTSSCAVPHAAIQRSDWLTRPAGGSKHKIHLSGAAPGQPQAPRHRLQTLSRVPARSTACQRSVCTEHSPATQTGSAPQALRCPSCGTMSRKSSRSAPGKAS